MTQEQIRQKAQAVLPALKALLFNDTPPAETEKVKAAEVTLVDGTVLSVMPALEVGATVTLLDSEGKEIPAPDGAHELQDGTVIEVAGGVITEVKAIEPTPAAAQAEPAAPAFTAADMEAAIAPLKAELAAQREAMKSMFSVVETLAAQPATAPTEPKAHPFAKKTDPEVNSRLALALSKLNQTN